MTITVKKKHDGHEISIHLCKKSGPHYAALRCIPCNKHIQWLNQIDAELIQKFFTKGN